MDREDATAARLVVADNYRTHPGLVKRQRSSPRKTGYAAIEAWDFAQYAPYRQWVQSLPRQLRFLLARDVGVEPSARVSCPITVFTGVEDTGAGPVAAAAWALRTTASCRIVELADAGHFFLASHRDVLLREIAADLAPPPG